jgi:conjugative transfer signal peptidase TraF
MFSKESIMTLGLSDRLPRFRRTALVTVLVSISVFQLFGFLGLRINTSPSLPVGLYVVTTDGSANLVEFCPAEPFATLSLIRGYRDAGSCRDGGAPLLKPVVANAGDLVELSVRGISVNGQLLPNTAPLPKDTKGRPLTPWPFGRYPLTPGTVWVASSYHSRSFDSRYFGPVYTTAIRHRLKAFLTL